MPLETNDLTPPGHQDNDWQQLALDARSTWDLEHPGVAALYENHVVPQLDSKGRFLGQQFARFFGEDQLYITIAEHANDVALKLYEGMQECGVQFDLAPDANQLFPTMSSELIAKLRKHYSFYYWEKVDQNNTKVRFVCSWATPEKQVDEFLNDLRTANS